MVWTHWIQTHHTGALRRRTSKILRAFRRIVGGSRPVLFVLSLICVVRPILHAQPPSRLHLRQVRTISLPAAYEMDGAALGPGHRIVAWSRKSAGILLFDGTRLRSVCETEIRQPVAAAFREHGNVVEVIDQNELRIWRVTETNHCARLNRISGLTEVLGADFSDRGWVMGIVDSTGHAGLALMSKPSANPSIKTRTRFFLRSGGRRSSPAGLREAHLRAQKNGAVAVSMRWPFALVLATFTGDLLHPKIVMQDLGDALHRKNDLIKDWLALAIVPLDKGYLQPLRIPAVIAACS